VITSPPLSLSLFLLLLLSHSLLSSNSLLILSLHHISHSSFTLQHHPHQTQIHSNLTQTPSHSLFQSHLIPWHTHNTITNLSSFLSIQPTSLHTRERGKRKSNRGREEEGWWGLSERRWKLTHLQITDTSLLLFHIHSFFNSHYPFQV
jgi:hypothetical protein